MAVDTSAAPGTGSPASSEMTYEQFLDWLGEDTHAEWVKGKVVPMSPVSYRHQDVVGFLLTLLRHFAEEHRLGVVVADPFQVKLGPDLSSRAPDLAFLAAGHLDRLKGTYLEGPADLVVEVISPGSRALDRGEKYYEYEKAGVGEYWLVDPERKQAEFYQLGPDGVYRTVLPEEGLYRSAVLPGLWLRVDWLWQSPLPRVREVLKEWGLL